MAINGGIDGSDPIRTERIGHLGGDEELRRVGRSTLLAIGTLACPGCDAPVAPGETLSPADPLACPVCDHASATRDFLSLEPPSRPARVAVRLVLTPAAGS
jgi:hypothetical protein